MATIVEKVSNIEQLFGYKKKEDRTDRDITMRHDEISWEPFNIDLFPFKILAKNCLVIIEKDALFNYIKETEN